MKKYTLHQVLVHTLSRCNLECKHCYAKNFNDELSLKELIVLFDEMRELGVSLCHLSGGEIFLRKDLNEIVDEATKRFPYVEITSNGLLLTQNICDIIKGRISKLVISLEGPEEKSNDEIRGNGVFKKALQAIKLAQDNEIKVGVNFTITSRNVSLVEDMIRHGQGLKLSFINFRRFIPAGAGKQNLSLMLSSKDYLKLNLIIQKARQTDKTIAMAGDPTRILMDANLIKKAKFAGCMAGIAMLSINPNGDIHPCGYLDYKVGNIKEQSLTDIWNNSPILKQLRDRNNLKGKCGKCHNKNICGGCRAAAYASSGDIFAEDPMCWLK